jgi:hypothetical protein
MLFQIVTRGILFFGASAIEEQAQERRFADLLRRRFENRGEHSTTEPQPKRMQPRAVQGCLCILVMLPLALIVRVCQDALS